MTGLCKIDELRFKTDRQLIRLVHNELYKGIRAACEALKSADDLVATNAHRRTAKSAHSEAAHLMSFLGATSWDERSAVESKLDRLQEMLEPLSAIGSTPVPTEDNIAALARALWEARGCPEGLPEEDWYRAERVLRPRAKSFAACIGS
jgi:hypothetical protein